MKTLEQVSGELLGQVIFEDPKKHFFASDFVLSIDERTHKPIVQFKCRFENNGQTVEDDVVRKLDFEDRQLDRTIECGSVIESMPEYEAIAVHIDYILEACGLTREKLAQAALNGKTQIEADAVTDIMHGINEKYLSQKDATDQELRKALEQPMEVPEALKEYVAKELQMFIDNDIPLPDGREDYRDPPQHGIVAEPLVNIFEKNLSLYVFNTASFRLRINNLEAVVVEEDQEQKPAVRIDADIIRSSGADNYVVEVPIDFVAYPGQYENEEDTIMNNMDVILEAFGLDRDKVRTAIENDEKTAVSDLQPEFRLTEFQQLVFNLFAQQKMHPEEIPELIVQDKLSLPPALLQAAQERFKECFEEQAKKFSVRR